MISSPFLRAVQSIQPTLNHKQIQLELDHRLELSEKAICSQMYCLMFLLIEIR
ncbi:hypothetical protein [Gottfriedia solisilvae]|uniref:hypothetical protein n=1 Tax=Gottfriedia solisilvae TaxID=1516104 RepID=UPI003D2EB795